MFRIATLTSGISIGLIAMIALGGCPAAQRSPEQLQQHPSPLPERPPDFAMVERVVHKVAEEPWFAERFELEHFAHDEWLARVWFRWITDEPPDDPERFELQWRLINQVSAQAGLPGRISGVYREEVETEGLRGSTVEFGYTIETGYDRANPRDELERVKQ